MNTRASSKRGAIEPAKRQASKRARPTSWEEVRANQTSSDDDSDCSGADELELQLFLAKTMRADLWPLSQPPPARIVALDGAGPWGAAASGVVIQDCEESAKGKGAFVTRTIGSGSFVGLYVGEVCTQRMRNLRHYDRQGLQAPTAYEQGDLDARTARLDSLTAAQGKPAGGSHNGGAYVFSLLPEASEAVEKHLETAANDEILSCIDAEDPLRSSWGRYINHAPAHSTRCNLAPRVDFGRQLVWFEASRDIAVGEELSFDYGPDYNAPWAGSASGSLVAVA